MFSTGQRAHCLCLNGQRKPKHRLQFSNEDKDEKVTHTNFFSVKFDTGRIVGIIQMSSNDEMIFFIWKSRGYLIASLHVRGHTFRLSKSNWVLGNRKGLDLLKVVYCLYSRGVENLNWEQTLRQKLPALVVGAKHGRFFQSCLCSHYWVVHIFILSSTSPKLDPASLTKIGTKLSSPELSWTSALFFWSPTAGYKMSRTIHLVDHFSDETVTARVFFSDLQTFDALCSSHANVFHVWVSELSPKREIVPA